MCDCEQKLDELQGQLDALQLALSLKLSNADRKRLFELLGDERIVDFDIPSERDQSLEFPVTPKRESFVRTINEVIGRAEVWDSL